VLCEINIPWCRLVPYYARLIFFRSLPPFPPYPPILLTYALFFARLSPIFRLCLSPSVLSLDPHSLSFLTFLGRLNRGACLLPDGSCYCSDAASFLFLLVSQLPFQVPLVRCSQKKSRAAFSQLERLGPSLAPRFLLDSCLGTSIFWIIALLFLLRFPQLAIRGHEWRFGVGRVRFVRGTHLE